MGGVPVIQARVSFSGELGYEVYCKPQCLLKLFEEVEAVGGDSGLTLYGARALMSLRLEKNWGAWTLDFRPDFTAAESGLDAFIDWSRDFIGKEAALKEKQEGPKKRLVTLCVASNAIDVSNDEAILKDGEAVGYVTSGGFAHHLGQSMALGYLPSELAHDGAQVEVEILGNRYPARVTAKPLYDPEGRRMRG